MEVFALSLKLKEEGAAAVKAATDKLRDSLKGVGKDSTTAGEQSAKGFKRMELAAAAAAVAVGVALVGALKNAIEKSSTHQFVQAQLASALKSTGNAAGQSVSALNAHAAALQKVSNFGDETINRAQALLLTFTQIQGDTFPKATEAVLNVATAMGTDLKSAAIQVGKALNDPILGVAALARSGIQFTAAQKEMIKALVESGQQVEAQALILKELENQFGGSAKAARDTLGGALQSLKNAFGDLFEVSVDGARPAITAIEGLTKAVQGIGGALDYVRPLLIGFIGLLTVTKWPLIVSTIGALANTVWALAPALTAAAAAQIRLNLAMAANPVALAILALSGLTAGVVAFVTAQQKAAEARDEEVAQSPAYLAALEAVRARREAATAAENAGVQAARDAADEATKRTANLFEFARLTTLTNGQMDELVALQSSLTEQYNNGNQSLSERIRLLKLLKETEDAILKGETQQSADVKRRADEAMERARGGRSATSVGGGIAAGGVMTFGGQASTALEDFARDGAMKAQKVADELALSINDSFGNAVSGSLIDGLSSGIAAAIGSGRISDAWQAMSQAIVQNIASAMVTVALASIEFGTLMTKIQAFLVANPVLAVAAAAAMLAFAYNNGGKARSGGKAVTGGIGGASFTPMMPMGQTSPTQLIFGATSATTAAGMTPRQAINVTIIGPNDPTAQRAMQELLRNANQRGNLG